MEVFVVVPRSRGSVFVFPRGSVVEDVLDRFVPQQNFYVTSNGRLAPGQAPLQDGGVYRLEPRLCGGKGGFGSMLRALGAQIEKTTNREACRDLSGRRLRDVNHEKEMAEWLKKQAEREAEKEQRRLERLQRKLAPPKHQFCDPEYQQQCHHLSERLEDSVLKGLQASSSAQAAADDITTVKRASSTAESEAPPQKKKKKAAAGGGASASFWTGLEDLEELQSSGDEEESLSSQAACRPVTTATEAEPSACRPVTTATEAEPSACRPVTMATEAEPTACRSSSADHVSGPAAENAGPSAHSKPSEPAPEEAGPAAEPAAENAGPSAHSKPSEPAPEEAGPPAEDAGPSSNSGLTEPAAEPAAEPDVVSPKEQRPPEAQESCYQSQQVCTGSDCKQECFWF
ncbi:SDE2-like protein [Oryzias melastigma]|uniref:SDE2-like protein n=1 Tax=Oryzias melastigma TaxID=30732 RepID=A0A834FHK2_ORYME|nr:SDE2-like protein [Oryzias melastigma]